MWVRIPCADHQEADACAAHIRRTCHSPRPAAAAKTGTDWPWLSASLTDCVEVFVTDGYAGAPILPTAVRIKNKDNHMVVTMPSMVPSTTQAFYYSWAQVIDTHGNAIPHRWTSPASGARTAPTVAGPRAARGLRRPRAA